MRAQLEIQRAHDMMAAVLCKEVRIDVTQDQIDVMAGQCAVLCWVLGELDHEPGLLFAKDLSALARLIEAAGYQLQQASEPFIGPPPGSPPRN